VTSVVTNWRVGLGLDRINASSKERVEMQKAEDKRKRLTETVRCAG